MSQKKAIVRGRHSFCLSCLTKWQEQLQLSDITAVSQISGYLTDENRYQPKVGKKRVAILIHAANSLPACLQAILHPKFPMTRAAANHCNLANTSSLLANSNLREIWNDQFATQPQTF
jgi:hypothetical protein